MPQVEFARIIETVIKMFQFVCVVALIAVAAYFGWWRRRL
jgi:hypothetical protein